MPDNENAVTLQRRHFQFIAEMIRDTGSLTRFQKQSVAIEWAAKLRTTNSRFNADTFVAAATADVPEGRPEYVPTPPPVMPVIPAGSVCAMTGCWRIPGYIHRPDDNRYFCARHAGSSECCVPGAIENNN